MKVDKVRVLKTLKCGESVFDGGSVIEGPIPHCLLSEIREKTGTVEVLVESPDDSEESPMDESPKRVKRVLRRKVGDD